GHLTPSASVGNGHCLNKPGVAHRVRRLYAIVGKVPLLLPQGTGNEPCRSFIGRLIEANWQVWPPSRPSYSAPCTTEPTLKHGCSQFGTSLPEVPPGMDGRGQRRCPSSQPNALCPRQAGPAHPPTAGLEGTRCWRRNVRSCGPSLTGAVYANSAPAIMGINRISGTNSAFLLTAPNGWRRTLISCTRLNMRSNPLSSVGAG